MNFLRSTIIVLSLLVKKAKLSVVYEERVITFIYYLEEKSSYCLPIENQKINISLCSPIDLSKGYSFLTSKREEADHTISGGEAQKSPHPEVMSSEWSVVGEKVNFKYYGISLDEYSYNKTFLGFGYPIRDPQFSFVHMIKSQNNLRKNAFGFSKLNGGHLLTVFLGGVNERDVNSRKKKGCEAVDRPYWGCNLSYIYVNGKVYESKNEELMFQTNEYRTYVTKKFYDFLQKNILLKYINNKKIHCQKKGKNEIFVCFESYPKDLPMIEFIFDAQILSLNLSDIFVEKEKNVYQLSLEVNPRDENKWELGTNFLSRYITEFNYDEKMINFYVKEEPYNYLAYTQNHKVRKIIMVNFIVFFIMMSLVISLLKIKSNILVLVK